MNEVHGTTALWLGSHRDQKSIAYDEEEGIEPVVREGSCMLWDFRLSARRHAEPKHRAASTIVPDILSTLVCGSPQL